MSRTMSKRFGAGLPQPLDPCLCCVACGAESPMHDPRDVYDEREDWKRLWKKRKGRVAYVSDKELEQTDFRRHPGLWLFFHRTSQFSFACLSLGVLTRGPQFLMTPKAGLCVSQEYQITNLGDGIPFQRPWTSTKLELAA